MNIRVKWNPPAGCWVADISDINNTPVLVGVPLVTGANLLEQFLHLGFSGKLIAQTDNAPDVVPTFTNLGTTGHLYYLTP